ncbi:hypothetical protein CEP54_003035 [Fusarium duplospermum]|uniref:Uncharacterized protein n=1 Tax=Fusarium duplospermum TaxID=1325734 RepID=A0A428QRV0_9HYPO|nr:hypothetical protein CEP54_003035 [Fusarium duplospermum]
MFILCLDAPVAECLCKDGPFRNSVIARLRMSKSFSILFCTQGIDQATQQQKQSYTQQQNQLSLGDDPLA